MENDLLNLWHTMDKKYEKYRPRLLKSNELLFNLKDPEEKVKIIKDLYAFVKEIAPEFYVEDRQEFISLKLLVQILSYCEDALDNEYLIDVTTNKEKKDYFSKEEILLNNFVHLNRKYLLDLLTMCGRYNHSFDFYSLEDYCEKSCDNISSLCELGDIKCHKIKMNYGFKNNLQLFEGRGFHCFTILELNENKYLVDTTYKQFFLLKRGLLERIGIPYLGGCYAGAFMLMTENRRKIAEKLIKEGWIQLTEEVFKEYMDGFLLSWRNGIYYEETGDFSYETSYTAEDYLAFLTGEKSILSYEKKFTLGFQERPLKDPTLSFRRH